jgi:hypothetical protein
MIDKVTSAIRDASFGSPYVAANVCSEPLPDDGVTEIGDAVPRVAVLIFEHPLRKRVQQRIKAKRTLKLLRQSEIQACEYCHTESSNTNLRVAFYPVVQSPETARHWDTMAGFPAAQRAEGIKEQ